MRSGSFRCLGVRSRAWRGSRIPMVQVIWSSSVPTISNITPGTSACFSTSPRCAASSRSSGTTSCETSGNRYDHGQPAAWSRRCLMVWDPEGWPDGGFASMADDDLGNDLTDEQRAAIKDDLEPGE